MLFVILPHSRRVGNLRRAQLIRARLYCLWGLPIAWSASVILKFMILGWLIATQQIGGSFSWLATPVNGYGDLFFLVLWIWQPIFWLCAIIRGWRLHRGVVLWLLLAIVVFLASVFTALIVGALGSTLYRLF